MSESYLLNEDYTIAFYSHAKTAPYNFMSNFYPCKIIVENVFNIKELDKYDELVFNSSEQLFMFGKCLTFLDADYEKNIITLLNILHETDPAEAKKHGRNVSGFNENIWEIKRFECMVNAVTLKFKQNYDIKLKLLETGKKYLIEASPYDTIWGVGLSKDNPNIYDKSKWKGLNLLGDVLMHVRSTILTQ